MKRLFLSILLVLGLAVHATAQTPLPIHATSNPGSEGESITGTVARLPTPILPHNAGFALLNNQAGASPTDCTDDKMVAWTLAVSRDDSNQRLHIYYTLDRTDGPQVLTCTFAAGRNFVALNIAEFSNIAATGALDKTCGDSFVGTTVDCSTAATTEAGELVIAFATQTATDLTRTGWTPGTGYSRLLWDTLDSSFAEYQVQAAAGVANPVFNKENSGGIAVAATFKTAANGTAATGMYPINVFHAHLKSGDTAPVFSFPCRGDENSIIIGLNGAAGRDITGMASANTTGSWAEAGSGTGVIIGPGLTTFWYLENGTCGSTTTITPTFSGGQAQDTELIIISLIGGAATLLDPATPVSSMGTDVTGSAFTGSSITATHAGWVFAYIGAATGPGGCEGTASCSQVVGSPGYFISPTTVPVLDTNPVGENQGGVLKTVTAAETYTVTWTPNGHPIGGYADYVAIFNAAGGGGGGGGATGHFTTMGIGK